MEEELGEGGGGGNCFKDSTLTFLSYFLKAQETPTKVVMINWTLRLLVTVHVIQLQIHRVLQGKKSVV